MHTGPLGRLASGFQRASGQHVLMHFRGCTPFSGLVRSLVAVSSLITIGLTGPDYLFRATYGTGSYPLCDSGPARVGLFCLVDRSHYAVLQWAMAGVLVWIIVGYFPRWTGILHLWIAFSIFSGIVIPDGGDQVCVFVTSLLLPLGLADSRRNHWHRVRQPAGSGRTQSIMALVSIFLLKGQMTVVYLGAATGKIGQNEWSEGSAMYYISYGLFGPSGILGTIFKDLLSQPWASALMTWGTIGVELSLASVLLLRGQARRFVTVLGLLLHVLIAIIMGIVSFQFAMFAGLLMLATPLTSAVYRPEARFRTLLRDIWTGFASTQRIVEDTSTEDGGHDRELQAEHAVRA